MADNTIVVGHLLYGLLGVSLAFKLMATVLGAALLVAAILSLARQDYNAGLKRLGATLAVPAAILLVLWFLSLVATWPLKLEALTLSSLDDAERVNYVSFGLMFLVGLLITYKDFSKPLLTWAFRRAKQS